MILRSPLFRSLCAAATAVMLSPASVDARDDFGLSTARYTFEERDGEAVYRGICQGCHMPDGAGAHGAGRYPALANNPRLAAAPYPALIVLNGAGAMPGFADGLDDEQIANVVNYLRSHFGNDYADPLTPEQVGALRR